MKIMAMVLCACILSSCDFGSGGKVNYENDFGSVEKVNYAKIFVFWDGFILPFSGIETHTLSSFSSLNRNTGIFYSVDQTSINKAGGVLAPNPVIIDNKPTKIEQCGTYTFVISVNGDVKRIANFKYSGERNIEVARGIGWSIFITRDDWKL
jgi:hypothetical protein